MDLSIVICTYNRADVLTDTLRSFLSLHELPGARFELLVVDNRSSDATAGIVRGFMAGHPERIRYVFEPTPGLSHARNRGIRETAAAAIVAFVDDDIYFDPQWLIAVLGAFRAHPEGMGLGGRSIPVFESGQPAWVNERISRAYGSTNSGMTARPMIFPEHPFGLNMAFRREVFEKVGLFNTKLGRQGASLLSNEETDYFSRVHDAGMVVRYAPEAIVKHRIAPVRAKRRWVLKRYYWQGVSDVVALGGREALGRRDRLRRAYWAARRLPAEAGGVLRQALHGQLLESSGMDAMIRLSSVAGEVRQWVQEALWT